MQSCIYKNGTTTVLHGQNIEWDATHYCTAEKLTDEERVAFDVFDYEQPTNNPGELERITGIEYAPPTEQRLVRGAYIVEPLPLAEAQAMLISRVKSEAGSRLSATDWKITRAAEGVKPCDQATLDHRAAIRAASDTYEAAVLTAQSTTDLAGLSVAWPE